MSVVPQINAQLLEVTGGGLTKNYTLHPSGTTPAKWTGSSGAYVREITKTAFNAQGGLNRYLETTIYLDDRFEPTVKSGDTVTYTWKNRTYAAKVQNITLLTLPGSPSYLKALLEDVNAS